eukprot:gnl/Chilomastix_cuspidata/2046.p1 GENE.gnl/Chilomastix_cuspidata/2046~~gnl/Chilomastix_cuspidata/2046.p1  ORF type:complete len:425 (+),score=90.26 gnl/Chilomastix_cuspidata/2046:53-1327(+)
MATSFSMDFLETLSVKNQATEYARSIKFYRAPVFGSDPEPDSEHGLALYMRCHAHNKQPLGLCIKCDMLVCDSCITCLKSHTITPLAAVVARAYPEPLDVTEVRALTVKAREAVPAVHIAAADALQADREAERKAKMHAEIAADVPRIRAQDTGELARLRGELAVARNRVDSETAKAALTAAREKLKVDAEIDAELAHYTKAFNIARSDAARARITSARLQGTLAHLEFVAEQEQFPRDTEDRAMLALFPQALRVAKTWQHVDRLKAFHAALAVHAAEAKELAGASQLMRGPEGGRDENYVGAFKENLEKTRRNISVYAGAVGERARTAAAALEHLVATADAGATQDKARAACIALNVDVVMQGIGHIELPRKYPNRIHDRDINRNLGYRDSYDLARQLCASIEGCASLQVVKQCTGAVDAIFK